MAERTFFVRLNLDDMGAESAALDSTEERGQWMEGFLVGSRGHESREHWPRPKLEGHAFGRKCFEEAEQFREKQAAKGRASGESRRKGTGAEPEPNHGSTAAEPGLNQTPTEPEPIQQPTSNNQGTNNEQPTPQAPQGGPALVVDAWNAKVAGTNLPKARVTTPRSRVIATRLKERGWLDDFHAAVDAIIRSDFHRGDNDRGWIADIDYLLQAGKSTQLAEKARAAPLPTKQPGKTQWTGVNEKDFTAGTDELRRGQNGRANLL